MSVRTRHKILLAVGLLMAFASIAISAFLRTSGGSGNPLVLIAQLVLVIGGGTLAFSNIFALAFHQGEPEPAVNAAEADRASTRP